MRNIKTNNGVVSFDVLKGWPAPGARDYELKITNADKSGNAFPSGSFVKITSGINGLSATTATNLKDGEKHGLVVSGTEKKDVGAIGSITVLLGGYVAVIHSSNVTSTNANKPVVGGEVTINSGKLEKRGTTGNTVGLLGNCVEIRQDPADASASVYVIDVA